MRLDVTDAEAFRVAVERVLRHHGRLDLLVNNAGTAVTGEVQDLGLDHWDRVIDVNLRGVVHGVHAAYPRMIAAGRGHIVNVASFAALGPAPLMVPYGATKWGVLGLSLGLRCEAAGYGIGVTVVCPGVIETPLLERQSPDGLPAPATAPQTRRWVSRDMQRAYPPDALAADVLEAVRRNQAVLVAPRRARAMSMAMRHLPGLALRVAERRMREEREARRR